MDTTVFDKDRFGHKECPMCGEKIFSMSTHICKKGQEVHDELTKASSYVELSKKTMICNGCGQEIGLMDSHICPTGEKRVIPAVSKTNAFATMTFTCNICGQSYKAGDGHECLEPLPEPLPSASVIDFADYQTGVALTKAYPSSDQLRYVALGIAGEAGEIANKVKKIIRDHGGIVTPEMREAILDECGDCLWYICAMCMELDDTLGNVARSNLLKLRDRKQRGTLHGSGDRR